MAAAPPHRVLILGGGHAGVQAARELLRSSRPQDRLEIAILSRENAEAWHELMPQIVSNVVQPQHVMVPLREILPGVTLYTYEIERIDLANRRVTLTRGGEGDEVSLEWDYLVLGLGSVTDFSRFPGLVEHGLQTKTIGDFFHLRNHLIDMLEAASVETDPETRRQLLTFLVAGAAFAGVELASEANELIRDALRFYPGIRPSEIRVVMVDVVDRVLPTLNENLAARATRHMQRRGIEIKLGVGLASATANLVTLSNGERIPTRTIIATVGIGPNPLIQDLPVQLTRGRIRCDEYARVPGWPGVYAAGDNAAIPNPKTGQPFPALAVFALEQGRQAARNILAEIRGQPLIPALYHATGQMGILSKGYGVAQIRRVALDGIFAAVYARLFFLVHMPNWHRRSALLLDWLSSMVSSRDITQLLISRSNALIPMRFGAGEVILRAGEPGSRFYIITEGEVEVVRPAGAGREEPLARLGPGKYFGEIALLQHSRRTATVRATTETRLLSIARQDFSALVEHLPVLRAVFDGAPYAEHATADRPTGHA